jgi:ornithine cyclodeaminase
MGASIYAVHFAPGSIDMWLTVFSGTSGRMLGVINSKQLSVWKTAATAAVAARALARPDAKQLALIGTGSYALAQLTFIDAVLPFETIRCFSRTRATLKAFCGEAQKVLGRRVLAAESVREAVEAADVITTITTSPAPVLFGSWLPEGVHCNVMGQHSPDAREVDTEAVLRSRVFVDSKAQALDEKGELLVPMAQHVITQAHIVGELGAVLTGRLTGRTSAGDLTMFCSGGTAFEYMALCAMLLEKAEAAGIGQVLTP